MQTDSHSKVSAKIAWLRRICFADTATAVGMLYVRVGATLTSKIRGSSRGSRPLASAQNSLLGAQAGQAPMPSSGGMISDSFRVLEDYGSQAFKIQP